MTDSTETTATAVTPVPRRIVVGVSGASGMPYAWGLLQGLRNAPGIETHCIVSAAARKVLALETDFAVDDFLSLADVVHDPADVGAGPASGSWDHAGMVVCPCSMASLAAIANGLGSNLLHRAADVTLKERRPLVLVVRETPLNRIHIQNMLAATDAGARIMPASPGFYGKPSSIEALVWSFAGRIMDQLGISNELADRWQGG